MIEFKFEFAALVFPLNFHFPARCFAATSLLNVYILVCYELTSNFDHYSIFRLKFESAVLRLLLLS